MLAKAPTRAFNNIIGTGKLQAFFPFQHHQISPIHRQRGQADDGAGAQAGGVVGAGDAGLPRRDAQGHQAIIDLFDFGRFPVDGGGKSVVVGHTEKHQPVGVVVRLGGKAGAGGGKVFHGLDTAGGAILGVGVLRAVGQPVVRDRLQQVAIGGDLVLVQQHRPQQ